MNINPLKSAADELVAMRDAETDGASREVIHDHALRAIAYALVGQLSIQSELRDLQMDAMRVAQARQNYGERH